MTLPHPAPRTLALALVPALERGTLQLQTAFLGRTESPQELPRVSSHGVPHREPSPPLVPEETVMSTGSPVELTHLAEGGQAAGALLAGSPSQLRPPYPTHQGPGQIPIPTYRHRGAHRAHPTHTARRLGRPQGKAEMGPRNPHMSGCPGKELGCSNPLPAPPRAAGSTASAPLGHGHRTTADPASTGPPSGALEAAAARGQPEPGGPQAGRA